ncbi:hypothetical protein ZEAMMB73_Zm00001d047642 [Zea mays]|uniref:Uncharacterized protein n=1 Tax=Zea mays TaxID=4577 RepID=A0A1D6PC34_MAIZE|nr:hypothetical protein ZEAMMB73_Zm00001d047642 [Zea mays]
MYLFGAVIFRGINVGEVKKLQDTSIYSCNCLLNQIYSH